MTEVIKIEGIHKNYGSFAAVDDISFSVAKGEIFGIVGPNGAGKTTTMGIVTGLRAADRGSVRVLNLDPAGQGRSLRQRIGIQLQEADLPDRLKVWEALALFASFYKSAVEWEPLLAEWGLAEKRNAPFGGLSGGQKQRVFIALALINDPEIVFLDELTTGLDPRVRRQTWDLVRAVRERGKTVIQVTHSMDEAEALCDRVAVIDRGKVIALDSPSRLLEQFQTGQTVTFSAAPDFEIDVLKEVKGVTRVERQGVTVTVHGEGPLLVRTAARLHALGQEPMDLSARRSSLEDVFLKITGA